MKRISLILVSLGLLASTPVLAVDGDAVLGGAIGGGLGAAVGSEIGGRNGAIAGGAIGAAVGVAVATDGDDHGGGGHVVHIEEGHSHGGPPAHAYRAPPGHVKHKHKRH